MHVEQRIAPNGILRKSVCVGKEYALKVRMSEVKNLEARWLLIPLGLRRNALLFVRSEAGRGWRLGQTLVEYSLLLGLIAVSLIVSVSAFGDEVVELYDYIVGKMSPALGGS